MSQDPKPQLGRLVVTPLVTIGVLAAMLMWEMEHVGSLALASSLVVAGFLVAVFVAKRVRRWMELLTGHYERLLRTADEQSRRAEAASRLKDEFLLMLSHELRTPINSMLGWARLLGTGKLDAATTARAVRAIERAGWAESRMVDDLLDMSRIAGGELALTVRRTSVQRAVTSALQSLSAEAEGKRIRIDTFVEPNLPPIVADPDRLQQIVWNLLSNAIKFTPRQGRVELEVRAEDPDLSLIVKDNGIGFDERVAAHLFERFRQGDSSTTRQFGGIGLGLGIVRHLVELHGGTVAGESPGPKRGATFRVRLPLRRAGENANAPAIAPRVDVSPDRPTPQAGIADRHPPPA